MFHDLKTLLQKIVTTCKNVSTVPLAHVGQIQWLKIHCIQNNKSQTNLQFSGILHHKEIWVQVLHRHQQRDVIIKKIR